MNLRQIARPHSAFDGAVTFYMLPHKGVGVQRVLRRFMAAFGPTSAWDEYQRIYSVIVPGTAEIEFNLFDDNDHYAEIQQLQAFWEGRPSDPVTAYECFELLITDNVIYEWQVAYTETRPRTMLADEVLQGTLDDDAPEEEKKDGAPLSSDTSTSSGGKRKSKSSAKTSASSSSAITT